jgi:hypothetical protein
MSEQEIRDEGALHRWVQEHLGVDLAREALVEGHSAPFEYVAHSFFEGRRPGGEQKPADCIVWANRGGGKTFLGAVATVLDLLFKPGIQVRILAGSLEQASRMHAHQRRFFEGETLKGKVAGRITDRRIALVNGSKVELLAQSQPSVRGVRPHRLRCDEVELFDPEVWRAAQLTTRSETIDGLSIQASIECLSTMHRPHGLMSKLLAERGSRTVFKWGVVDVLERCGDEHKCGGDGKPECPLRPECGGGAKDRGAGHMTVADAKVLKSRVSAADWEAEMLCLRPNRGATVFPEFDRAMHVVEGDEWERADGGRWLAGMDFGFRSPTVVLWAVCRGDVLVVVDERCEAGRTLEEHIGAILGSRWPRPEWIGVDPAGESRHEQTGVSNVTLLRRAGLEVRARRSGVVEGLAQIRRRLKPGVGPARLLVHARCRGLIEALEAYHFDEEHPEREAPVKDGPDHAVDALRYLVVNLDGAFEAGRGRWA